MVRRCVFGAELTSCSVRETRVDGTAAARSARTHALSMGTLLSTLSLPKKATAPAKRGKGKKRATVRERVAPGGMVRGEAQRESQTLSSSGGNDTWSRPRDGEEEEEVG